MSEICWTKEQERAIAVRAKTVLVSAAAGSGKTAVLTERAVHRMLDDNPPVSADRLLVITFTRAAANEMKARIKARLSQRATAGDAFSARQLMLLDRAVIGTIDAMCMEIIRENFTQLDVSPAMRIGEEIENSQIRRQAVEQVLEEAYSYNNDKAFGELVELFASKRDDEVLAVTILAVLDYARVHPHYRDWLKETLAHYDTQNPAESPWGLVLIERARGAIEQGLALCGEALEEIVQMPVLAPYLDAITADRAFFEELEIAVDQDKWDSCREMLLSFRSQRFKPVKTDKTYLKDRLKSQRQLIKDLIDVLKKDIFSGGRQDFREDIADLRPKIERLFRLVLRCDDLLKEKKRAVGIYEFSDLIQLALTVLTEKQDGKIVPTAAAAEYAARFDEVMVDEYQDINRAQDAIINALTSKNQAFLVGDVKQCIYRFRHASPELFEERAKKYAGGAIADEHLLTLSGNFRSRSGIIDAVNETFLTLMSQTVGGVDYAAGHQLQAMASYVSYEEPCVSMYLVDKESNDEDEDANEREANFAAQTVAKLLDSGKLVGQGENRRPIQPGDIAILMRSVKNKAERYRAALEKQGIFARVGAGSVLESREIVVMHSMLRALDNPTRDIDLAAALLSPLFGMTDDELAQMRLALPKGSLYAGLTCFAQTNDKAKHALLLITKLRQKAALTDAVGLIYEIYAETGYDTGVLAQSNGEQRRENLLFLARLADDWNSRGHRDLSSFVSVLDRMRERQAEASSVGFDKQSEAVAITTIHSAKGLEWPVVLLTDTAKKFGFDLHDKSKPFLLHPELGFACVRRDEQRKAQYASLPLAAVRIAAQKDFASEEMRILYVAMTRAKEQLIITAAMKDPTTVFEKFKSSCGKIPPPESVGQAKSFADWLMLSAAANGAVPGGATDAGIKLEVVGQAAKSFADTLPGKMPAERDMQLYEKLKRRMEFVYPFAHAVEIPAKLSVSVLSHTFRPADAFSSRPAFLSQPSGKAIAFGREAGQALHKFMQLCDYTNAASDLKREIKRLCTQENLTAQEAALIDIPRLSAFFAGSLAKRILSSPKVLREFRFMTDASVSPLSRHLTGEDKESTLLQGIADCVFFEGEIPYVVDYKTDRVDDAHELAARYKTQLLLYRDMLSHIFARPVEGCILYSFWLGREINIETG